jgi:hypothetical protein
LPFEPPAGVDGFVAVASATAISGGVTDATGAEVTAGVVAEAAEAGVVGAALAEGACVAAVSVPESFDSAGFTTKNPIAATSASAPRTATPMIAPFDLGGCGAAPDASPVHGAGVAGVPAECVPRYWLMSAGTEPIAFRATLVALS